MNDASTDRTAALADALGRAPTRASGSSTTRGTCTLGGSLRAGFAAAPRTSILYTDADLPFDLEEMPRAVRLLRRAGGGLALRLPLRPHRGGHACGRSTPGATASSSARCSACSIRDVNFAFKLFRRSLLDRFVLKSEGSFIDAELLVRARKAGASIIQIGVDYFPRTRGVSKLASGQVIVAHPVRAGVALARAALRPAVTRAARVAGRVCSPCWRCFRARVRAALRRAQPAHVPAARGARRPPRALRARLAGRAGDRLPPRLQRARGC